MILYNQQSRNHLPQQMWKTHAETHSEHDLEMPGRLPEGNIGGKGFPNHPALSRRPSAEMS